MTENEQPKENSKEGNFEEAPAVKKGRRKLNGNYKYGGLNKLQSKRKLLSYESSTELELSKVLSSST